MDKPLLLLDVDGPLNPYAAPARRRPVGYRTIHVGRADGTVYDRNPGRGTVRVWLNPDHGPALLQMAGRFELWWATAWEDRANTIIAPQIGLPELPVLHFPPDASAPYPMSWKTPTVAELARPWVWVDDDHTDADRAWLAAHARARHRLHPVDPAIGLTDADVAALADLGADLATDLKADPEAGVEEGSG